MHPTEWTILADRFDYKEACGYIQRAGVLGSRPGLSRIRSLCKKLGDPQDKLRFIHIAGTNGKGSTGAMTASMLHEGGLTVGMYYSPALCGIRDHYMINGTLISEDDYAHVIDTVAKANDALISETGESATQFELETAAAFTYFCANHCDVIVLECGMGGKDDATNIVRNKICCVFTSISYDHMQYLGNTLTDIATAKAGIITPGCTVVSFDDPPEVLDVIRKKCRSLNSRLYTVDRVHVTSDDAMRLTQKVTYEEFGDVTVPLCGTFQAENAALAMRTVSVINNARLIEGFSPDEDTIRKGIAAVRWPFRFECISFSPLVFVDGAHNADAAVKLWETIERCLAGYKIVLVMGMYADKEYEKVSSILAGLAEAVFTVQTPDDIRALPAEELAKCAGKYCDDVASCDSLEQAYDLAAKKCDGYGEGAAVIACGSLSYLGRFKDICDKRAKER